MKDAVLLLSLHFPFPPFLQANNMVIHTACRHFHESQRGTEDRRGSPHIVTSTVEHDSIRLPLEQLGKEGLAGEWHRHRWGLNGELVSAGVFGGGQDPACSVMFHFLTLEKGTISPRGCPCSPRLDVSALCLCSHHPHTPALPSGAQAALSTHSLPSQPQGLSPGLQKPPLCLYPHGAGRQRWTMSWPPSGQTPAWFPSCWPITRPGSSW